MKAKLSGSAEFSEPIQVVYNQRQGAVMKLVTDPNDTHIVQYLTSVISTKLSEGETVLWLVPGGSAMKIAVEVLARLEEEDTSNLCITLTDERYGRPDHQDENWVQLSRLGFDVRTINAYRILRGEDIETTAIDFSEKLERLFSTFTYKIGLFGMGADGHTAGIKPGSIATTSESLAEQFESDDFSRVTMTAHAISHLNEVVLYAHGAEKFEQIKTLLSTETDVVAQPAQALKQVRKLTIFSDYQD